MTLYARVEDGKIMEYRDLDMRGVGKHKRGMWKKVIDNPPNYNMITEVVDAPIVSINEATITYKYVVRKKTLSELQHEVKEEEYRRAKIYKSPYELYKDYVSGIKADQYLRDLANASKELQMLKSIPLDFADDKYWPTKP